MTEDRYVAAIEISSSKIVAVVGKIRPDGQLCIIASEQEKKGWKACATGLSGIQKRHP